MRSGETLVLDHDAALVSRIQRGETRLFEQLVRRHQDAVFGTALRFLGSPRDAEDVAQEVFLRAFRGIGAFKGEAKLSTWLFRITMNLCTDAVRRRKRRHRDAARLEAMPDVADELPDPQEEAIASEQREAVRCALESLDSRYRGVLVLAYYQRLSCNQIAAVLGVPRKTVDTRLYRGRRLLRARLARDRDSPSPHLPAGQLQRPAGAAEVTTVLAL